MPRGAVVALKYGMVGTTEGRDIRPETTPGSLAAGLLVVSYRSVGQNKPATLCFLQLSLTLGDWVLLSWQGVN